MTLLTDILQSETIPAVKAETGLPVQFDAGHYIELSNRIDQKKKGVNPVVYPLVWLVMDFAQVYTAASSWEYDVDRAKLFIVHKSDGTSSSLNRIETVFKPVLIPIWEAIKKSIQGSILFINPLIEPTIILRPYAAGVNDKSANLFNDTVDAIEISNISLRVRMKPIC